MTLYSKLMRVLMILPLSLAATAFAELPAQEIKWDDLIPEGFDLYEEQSKIFAEYDLEKLQDGTPEADEALARVQAISNSAPIVDSLDGSIVKIPGFAVPLEYQESVTRFLLVPYFGACIHTPPPPSNQIILVEPEKAVSLRSLADGAIYVTGKIKVEKVNSEIATSGYTMTVDHIEPYY